MALSKPLPLQHCEHQVSAPQPRARSAAVVKHRARRAACRAVAERLSTYTGVGVSGPARGHHLCVALHLGDRHTHTLSD